MPYKLVTSAIIKMNRLYTMFFSVLAFAGLTFLSHSALASGMEPWGMNLQESAGPVKDRMTEFHNLLLVIITLIVVFVTGLMLYIMLRFNAKTNPVPSKTTHNVLLEFVWTIIPVLILIMIAIPSFKLLYYQDRSIDADMTIKVVGRQWYWHYVYPGENEEEDDLEFSAYMIPDEDIDKSKNQLRLLSTDNQLVLPVDTDITIQVTADDVLHSYAMPAFGIKMDAVPGRLNETWVRISKPGRYYGQCSELCGKGHAYMPTEVVAVSKEEFAAWLKAAKSGTISYNEFESGYDVAGAR